MNQTNQENVLKTAPSPGFEMPTPQNKIADDSEVSVLLQINDLTKTATRLTKNAKVLQKKIVLLENLASDGQNRSETLATATHELQDKTQAFEDKTQAFEDRTLELAKNVGDLANESQQLKDRTTVLEEQASIVATAAKLSETVAALESEHKTISQRFDILEKDRSTDNETAQVLLQKAEASIEHKQQLETQVQDVVVGFTSLNGKYAELIDTTEPLADELGVLERRINGIAGEIETQNQDVVLKLHKLHQYAWVCGVFIGLLIIISLSTAYRSIGSITTTWQTMDKKIALIEKNVDVQEKQLSDELRYEVAQQKIVAMQQTINRHEALLSAIKNNTNGLQQQSTPVDDNVAPLSQTEAVARSQPAVGEIAEQVVEPEKVAVVQPPVKLAAQVATAALPKPAENQSGVAADVAKDQSQERIMIPAAPSLVSKDNHWFMQQDPQHFTLQLLGADSQRSLNSFVKQYAIADKTYIVSTSRNDKTWNVLIYGVYNDYDGARKALAQLPKELKKHNPWVRSYAGLQKVSKAKN